MTEPPSDGDKQVSLHERITADLEKNILSGFWHTGFRIPKEIDLAEQYGCSRMTVNKVLAHLVARGLIERRRRSGSFVRRPAAQSIILQVLDPYTDITALGHIYSYRLLSAVARPARALDRRRLRLEAGRVLQVDCQHLADGRVFCHEERIINLDALPDAATAPFENKPPGSWLIDRMPWRSGDHVIRAISADAHLAAAMAVPLGHACLCVERRTYVEGTHLHFGLSYYPGDRHQLSARFTTSQTGDKRQ